MPLLKTPVILIILDGWGVAPPSRGNAIVLSKTTNFDHLVSTYPTATLQSSGEAVGLPWGEMGNSEVGHMSLGSGKIIYQNLPRINKTISDGTFFKNKTFLEAAEHLKKNNSKLHLMGLVSSGGVHSSQDHLYALLEFCQRHQIKEVFIHAFLDGRDTPPDSAINFIAKLAEKIRELKIGKIATLSGRYYAMDRDNRWDRIEKAYRALTEGKSQKYFEDPITAIKDSYDNKIYDEEFIPTCLVDTNKKPIATVNEGDAVIFFNFRGDRARQLTKAFVLPGFEKFSRSKYLRNLFFVTMTEYEADLPVKIAFPPEKITEPIAKVISDLGLYQLHIAETEKYAHVTFFFNGGREEPFPKEDRILIPSPSVAYYDQKPEMSAPEITSQLVKAINMGKYAFLVVNFANLDMVGHTGKMPAIIKAVETVDRSLGEIVKATLGVEGGVVVTADHGNAEEKINLQTGFINKEHTTNPVPFIVVDDALKGKSKIHLAGSDLSALTPIGILADVAPTILAIMGIPKPKEMEGRSLLGYL